MFILFYFFCLEILLMKEKKMKKVRCNLNTPVIIVPWVKPAAIWDLDWLLLKGQDASERVAIV